MVGFALLIYIWLGRLTIAHRSFVSIYLESFLSLLFSLWRLCFHAFMLSVCSSSFDLEFMVTELNLFGQFSLFLLVWADDSFPLGCSRHLFNNYSYVPRLITAGYGVTKIWAHEPRSSSINCVLRVLLYSTRNKIL